ncbi:unnamed protein product [Trichogramma brassicae]|uniref:Uncharacterized protein n=1 Tax=Trichogramma brassicae TaxID=86971 RepID=A0A6H5IDW3_9HYME|nr:unnamed protein product [Trichogramma brassicae]
MRQRVKSSSILMSSGCFGKQKIGWSGARKKLDRTNIRIEARAYNKDNIGQVAIVSEQTSSGAQSFVELYSIRRVFRYIPGYKSRYGLTFMRAVEEGATEWRETQSKLRARRDTMRAQMEMQDPRNLLSRVRHDNVDIVIDHGHGKRQYFDNQVSAESPPIVGYTGHIPGARGQVDLSKRYAQAAKRGLELHEQGRRSRLGQHDEAAIQRVLDVACVDDTGHSKP